MGKFAFALGMAGAGIALAVFVPSVAIVGFVLTGAGVLSTLAGLVEHAQDAIAKRRGKGRA